MRLIVIAVAALLSLPSLAFGAEYLEKVESDVYETGGSKQEIAKTGKRCIATLVRNEEVRISDSSSGTGTFSAILSGPGSEGHSGGVQGGDVFVDVDTEGGIITANNRVDYRSQLIAHNVKSTMTFLAKEGRFKIRHTNIEYLQKSTGYMHNTGYSRVAKIWGTGWKAAEKALNGISEKVAECVKNGPEEAW